MRTSVQRWTSDAVATSRRRLATLRPWVGASLLLTPALVVLGVDAARRGDRILSFSGHYRWTYLGAVVESIVVWGALLYAASRRRGRYRDLLAVLFVVCFTLAVGGQRYFHDQYNAYLNVDVSVFASNFTDSVINQLKADLGTYLRAKLPLLIGAVLLIVVGRRWIRPRRRWVRPSGALAPALLVGSFFVPTQHRHVQASTPDVLYLNAIGGLIRTQLGFTDQSNQLRPRSRESLPVVLSTERPAEQPNIVFIILESVRADGVCEDPDAPCRKTPYSHALVPGRFPLTQMRSQASSTAISLAVLWAGVGPHESRDVLHTWPLIFDYAKARGYSTAFWTSQNMMFGNARLWVKNLGVDQFVSATELDPVADLDMGAPEGLLADHVNSHIDELEEPFLAVVQLSNVHYPYLIDETGPAPFQPMTTSKAPDANTAFFNLYLNSVHQQDRHVGRMIEHVKQQPFGARTVIVYTSDHGEAFREHNQMGHTFSIFDEEVHVPAWIDAPEGVLTEAQRASLRDKRDEFSFHSDLSATLIDLMGVWDDPGIARYRTRMHGVSLLRAGQRATAVPLTNCAGVWSCAFENWGYMRGPLKLEARSWDPAWRCFDVSVDPRESTNLGVEACGDLLGHTLRTFERLPGRQPD